LLGDSVEGWTLKSIRPSELVVANGERTETLALQRGKVKATSAGNGAGKNNSKSREQGLVGQVKAYPGNPTPPAGPGAGTKAAATTGSKPAAGQAEPEPSLGLGPQG
jgi:hypothetical protein